MPVTPTYPGIYIEEILSNAHTITAAPTSVTVFVGYTHPFKTLPQNYGAAIEIFSFTDYEREFGGLRKLLFNRSPQASSQTVDFAPTDPTDVSDTITIAATDPDADTLSYRLIEKPEHGTALDPDTGKFVYNPDDAFAVSSAGA